MEQLVGMVHPANSTLTVARAPAARVNAFGLPFDHPARAALGALFLGGMTSAGPSLRRLSPQAAVLLLVGAVAWLVTVGRAGAGVPAFLLTALVDRLVGDHPAWATAMVGLAAVVLAEKLWARGELLTGWSASLPGPGRHGDLGPDASTRPAPDQHHYGHGRVLTGCATSDRLLGRRGPHQGFTGAVLARVARRCPPVVEGAILDEAPRRGSQRRRPAAGPDERRRRWRRRR